MPGCGDGFRLPTSCKRRTSVRSSDCRITRPASDVPFFVWLRSVTMQRLIDVHRRHLGGQVRDAGREVRLGEVERSRPARDRSPSCSPIPLRPAWRPGAARLWRRCESARAARSDRPRGAGVAALRADEQPRSGRVPGDQAGRREQAVRPRGRAAQGCAGADSGFRGGRDMNDARCEARRRSTRSTSRRGRSRTL